MGRMLILFQLALNILCGNRTLMSHGYSEFLASKTKNTVILQLNKCWHPPEFSVHLLPETTLEVGRPQLPLGWYNEY